MPAIVEIDSPLGAVSVIVDGDRLCGLHFSDKLARYAPALEARLGPRETWRRAARMTDAATRIGDYFGGDLAALDAIDVETGGTAFQRAVWQAVRRIPAGATATYGEIARAIGAPAAVRAVGAANGANPVCLVVPCHRVIGAGGSLTGYGGGIERKRWLLAHESSPAALRFAAAAR